MTWFVSECFQYFRCHRFVRNWVNGIFRFHAIPPSDNFNVISKRRTPIGILRKLFDGALNTFLGNLHDLDFVFEIIKYDKSPKMFYCLLRINRFLWLSIPTESQGFFVFPVLPSENGFA